MSRLDELIEVDAENVSSWRERLAELDPEQRKLLLPIYDLILDLCYEINPDLPDLPWQRKPTKGATGES